jgi:CMP-N,N'-diacetyllegionaminic acid synthase
MKVAAFIPARGGSKRVPGKNIRKLGGYPLIAYAIDSALKSGLFDGGVYVSTDDEETARIAKSYGADIISRPVGYARDSSPDADWIRHALVSLGYFRLAPAAFFILRPTSPFRTAATILRAWDQFCMEPMLPLKAVSLVEQHPDKMWRTVKTENQIVAVPYALNHAHAEHHLLPTQVLPQTFVQNGCVEIRPVSMATSFVVIEPFATEGYEGYDINTEKDWVYAEWLIEQGRVKLPTIGGECCPTSAR